MCIPFLTYKLNTICNTPVYHPCSIFHDFDHRAVSAARSFTGSMTCMCACICNALSHPPGSYCCSPSSCSASARPPLPAAPASACAPPPGFSTRPPAHHRRPQVVHRCLFFQRQVHAPPHPQRTSTPAPAMRPCSHPPVQLPAVSTVPPCQRPHTHLEHRRRVVFQHCRPPPAPPCTPPPPPRTAAP